MKLATLAIYVTHIYIQVDVYLLQKLLKKILTKVCYNKIAPKSKILNKQNDGKCGGDIALPR